MLNTTLNYILHTPVRDGMHIAGYAMCHVTCQKQMNKRLFIWLPLHSKEKAENSAIICKMYMNILFQMIDYTFYQSKFSLLEIKNRVKILHDLCRSIIDFSQC